MSILAILISGCQSTGQNKDTEPKNAGSEVNTFGDDLDFLKKWDGSLVVLSSENGEGLILVSPKYQGKVFTSTAGGLSGKSFGWINYDVFDKEEDPHMNAYGGEDRLWLGPEGGPFSLYFAPGKEMVFENWHTPAPIDTEGWELVSSAKDRVRVAKNMELLNYKGVALKMRVERDVEILEPADIEEMLSVSLDTSVKQVGFRTTNLLKNMGNNAWNKQTGAPCMWSLDMFRPTPQTVIVIPYVTDAAGKVATTDYFGEIAADRIKIDSGIIYFKADGLSRGKLGVPPARVMPVAGSYSADEGVLTITLFKVDRDATYLNQEWTTTKDPFTGDAMNAYNDGPLDDGSQMGPFYEIESVSPAAFLEPKEELVHVHSVFHFTGNQESLNAISEKVLGTTLEKIKNVFEKK